MGKTEALIVGCGIMLLVGGISVAVVYYDLKKTEARKTQRLKYILPSDYKRMINSSHTNPDRCFVTYETIDGKTKTVEYDSKGNAGKTIEWKLQQAPEPELKPEYQKKE